MTYAVLSDIHPAACLERGLAMADRRVRGNHDKVVAGIASDRDFNDVAQAFPDTNVCLFGHTHAAGIIQQRRPSRAERAIRTPVRGFRLQPGDPLTLDEASHYLINPGSVGQPRDGTPDAAFGLFDAERARYTQFRVPYPVEVAQRKIRALGLPEWLADRLSVGR